MKQFKYASNNVLSRKNCGIHILSVIGTLVAIFSLSVAATKAAESDAAESDAAESDAAEMNIVEIEREATEIVRVYVGLRELVNARAADECCKEMITQLVVPIWQQRDNVSPRQHATQFVTVYETLTYEFQVRAARNPELKKLYPHFRDAIVSDIVPLPRGFQR